MNIYSYFQDYKKECLSVPSKNESLMNWCHFQVRQKALNHQKAKELMLEASQVLQEDTSLDEQAFKNQFLEKINLTRKHGMSYVFHECMDFGLFLFVYTTLFVVVYEQVCIPLFEQRDMIWMVDIGPSILIQTIGVYCIFKILITWFATLPKQSSLLFWIVLVILFGLYLGCIYIAGQVSHIVWFQMYIVLWICISLCILIGTLVLRKKES